MALTVITSTSVEADCGAVALSGPTKVVAEDMVEGDVVYIYEETGTAANYQKVPDTGSRNVILDYGMPSIIFEGYGNYKFVLGEDTTSGLVLGYAN